MPDRGADRWIVSKYTLVSWCGGRIEITSLISGAIFRTDSPHILQLLHAFARAKPIEEAICEFRGFSEEQVAACIDQMIDTGVLIKDSENELIADCWERSALAFHRTSRQPGFQACPSHKTAAVAAPRSPMTVPLNPPSRGNGRDFSDVLASRRSSRNWPRRPITRETFSTLLWMSARNRDFATDSLGGGFVSRPYPSGGAAYSLEIYPVIAPASVESIPAGVYRYLPESHGLEVHSEEASSYVPFLDAARRSAGSNAPPVVFVITSRFARQSEAYGDLAYSLVLKEVGALFQTLYLVAEYLELAACALGGGTPDQLLARCCNTAELVEPVVGEFMFGPR